jgi:hypothetical protein
MDRYFRGVLVGTIATAVMGVATRPLADEIAQKHWGETVSVSGADCQTENAQRSTEWLKQHGI